MRWSLFILPMIAVVSYAGTTVDLTGRYIYGANIGWIDASGDGIDGAVIAESFCFGYLWGANVGWISLGDGSPDDGMKYGNDSATDFGVNHDGLGNLSGFAYGANIGWINFEQTYGQPKINLKTGRLSGYIWGANVGWIHLADLKSRMAMGPDADLDGIPDAWEYGHTNQLTALGGQDSDGDGASDQNEYWADTDPFDPTDQLRITDLQVLDLTNTISWSVVPTREYLLEYTEDLTAPNWVSAGSAFIPASGPEWSEELVGENASNRFYRVKASLPLR